jgi:membrane associated rhomboid family serine protease
MIQLAENDDRREQEPFYTLFANSGQRALEWSAVLDSQNIPYELQKIPDGEGLVFILSEECFHKAMANIDAYESERSFFERFQELFSSPPPPLRLKIALPCIGFASLMTLFYFFSGPAADKSLWQIRGMLSAKFFSDSQWWCPVTALTLHADFSHLAGNMMFFIIFGTAAAVQTGAGAALFFILISGILGNLTTLMIFGDRVYNALGFSTAVFGVLGMLATLRLMQNLRTSKISSLYFWIPMVAAVAMFGLTGGSGGSDLSGHLFGFLWGVVCGFALHFLAKWRTKIYFQGAMIFITLLIITASWYAAVQGF